MSMHKKPLTPLEEEGLRCHGLDIGKPSQLSDVFRHGIAWALSKTTPDPENVTLPKELIVQLLRDVPETNLCARTIKRHLDL